MELVKIEQALFDEFSQMIKWGRGTIAIRANNTTMMTFWHIGERINDDLLGTVLLLRVMIYKCNINRDAFYADSAYW